MLNKEIKSIKSYASLMYSRLIVVEDLICADSIIHMSFTISYAKTQIWSCPSKPGDLRVILFNREPGTLIWLKAH